MKAPVDYILPPAVPGQVPYWRLVLRGISQMCFQSNELTGLFFLVAVLVASPISAAYLLVAGIMAPAGRMLMGERGPILATGLPGLNPCLIALALPAFFETGWTDVGMWVVLVVCVAITIVLVRICVAVLPFPTLALPFLIVFWALYALAPNLDAVQPLSFAATHDTFHPVKAVLLSLGQALFSPAILSGVSFATGVLLSNWRHGVLAIFGAIIGTVVADYYRDVDPASVDLGLYGFNGVLTAVAVFVFCGGKLRLSILGALLATMMMPAIADLGVQTLSAPFVFTTWLMLGLGWIEDNWFDVEPAPTSKPLPATKPARATKPSAPAGVAHGRPGDRHMLALTAPLVLPNVQEYVRTLREKSDWQPFRPGVTAHWFYQEPDGGASAVLLRYEPGARVALHEHVGYEHMLVLEGDQYDEGGSYPAGSFVIHPPGTRHSPGSVGGCVALLIYEKAVRFVQPE